MQEEDDVASQWAEFLLYPDEARSAEDVERVAARAKRDHPSLDLNSEMLAGSPLQWLALVTGHGFMIEGLGRAGFDWAASRGEHGQGPLHFLLSKRRFNYQQGDGGHPGLREDLDRICAQGAKALIEVGCGMDKPLSKHSFGGVGSLDPLMLAACSNCAGAVRELVRAGCDGARMNKKGLSAVDLSVVFGSVDAMEVFMELGYDVLGSAASERTKSARESVLADALPFKDEKGMQMCDAKISSLAEARALMGVALEAKPGGRATAL